MVSAVLKVLVMQSEPVESITTMEDAAQERWLDAIAIATERPSEALGCAYLLGYVVECSLKAALGRIHNISPAADLFAAVIQPIRNRDKHNLTVLLQECLDNRNPPLPPLRQSIWIIRVGDVAGAHDVSFRYKSYAVTSVALGRVYEDVEWIVENIEELWR